MELETNAALTEQIESAFPSKGGLYPHELLMLAHAPYYHTEDEEFPDFWYFQYHVEDPQALLESLAERSFIVEGDIVSALEQQPTEVLQEELQHFGMKSTGSREKLIERLITENTMPELVQKFSRRTYLLAEAGQRELEENPYILYLHRSGVMDIWEMNRRLGLEGDGQAFRPILLEHFEKEALEHLRAENYISYRNQCWEMYEFQRENGKEDSAFPLLCEVSLYDLSGLGNGERQLREFYDSEDAFLVSVLQNGLKRHFPYEESDLRLSDEILDALAEYQHEMKSGFRTKLTEAVNSFQLPRSVFTKEEAIDIILWELMGETEELVSLYGTVEFRQKSELMKLL